MIHRSLEQFIVSVIEKRVAEEDGGAVVDSQIGEIFLEGVYAFAFEEEGRGAVADEDCMAVIVQVGTVESYDVAVGLLEFWFGLGADIDD